MPQLAVAELRRGLPVEDAHFDRLYADWARSLSKVHWSPVAVAARAAGWLVNRPGTRVLDVGAGVGKFCLIGGLVSAGRFYGIEQCEGFVHEARALATRLGVSGTCFGHGNMMALDWNRFDAFYLYNPFENETDDVHVDYVWERLDAARAGTRVATFHGFGRAMPPGYRIEFEGERELEWLEMWIKA